MKYNVYAGSYKTNNYLYNYKELRPSKYNKEFIIFVKTAQ